MRFSLPAIVTVVAGHLTLATNGTLFCQPDLNGWDRIVRSMGQSGWVGDLESLEPGCVLGEGVPTLDPERFRGQSPWGGALIAALEALPLAEHHADRALQRLLADGMRSFRLAQAATDRYRAPAVAALEAQGLAGDWIVLPMALTGWDNAYYGPGRRAGPWAMDVSAALSHGLVIRRGWDERHVPERMLPAAIAHIQRAVGAFPNDPLRQVIAFVRGHQAAARFDGDALDAELLEWCHLLRVLLQVHANFDWDDTASLWLLRERDIGLATCPAGENTVYFSMTAAAPEVVSILREENPWFTTDSLQFNALRPELRIPRGARHAVDSPLSCGTRPPASRAVPVVTHVVSAGEVLGSIARDYGVRIEAIQRHNGLSSDRIQLGQSLEIPGATRKPHQVTAPDTREVPLSDAPWIWHTVREGESYWTIAQGYPHATMEDIIRMNDTRPEALRPGMQLRIPPP